MRPRRSRLSRASFTRFLATLLGNRLAPIVGFVVLPVLFLLWWQMGGAPGEVVHTSEAGGVITQVHQHAYLITLDDGREVRVFRTRKLNPGARVTLHVSRFESGVTQYVLPREGRASP